MAAAPDTGLVAEIGLDVTAEIEVLSRAPLQGPWQIPAELVRFLLARRAERVEVDLGLWRCRVRGWGAGVTPSDLERTATVLDPGTAATVRHAALVELEATEAMPLLWAAGGGQWRWRFEVATGRESVVLDRRARVPVRRARPGGEALVVLELRGRGLHRRQAADWLRSACRFVRVPVRLAGVDLGIGHREGAFRARLDRPLPSDLAIGTDGNGPALWLLRHGVVTARAAVPGYPTFAAAIEMASVTDPGASAAEARAAVQPYLTAVIAEAVRLMVRGAARVAEVAEGRRRALTVALLHAAILGFERRQILELPLLPLGPAGGESRWCSLSELCREGGARHAASDDEMRRLGLTTHQAARVLRLGPEERELTGRLTGTRTSPPPASSSGGLLGRLRRLRRGFVALLGWTTVAWRRRIPESALAASEAALVDALRRGLRSPGGEVRVSFVEGRGAPRACRRQLLLPRRDRRVAASVRALARGSQWVYPVLLTLAPAGWQIDPELVRSWRRGAGSRPISS